MKNKEEKKILKWITEAKMKPPYNLEFGTQEDVDVLLNELNALTENVDEYLFPKTHELIEKEKRSK